MNKTLSFAFALFALCLYAQNISDYKYVYIPAEFSDAKVNKYGLKDLLATQLKSKHFEIINNSDDGCNALKAELRDTSSFLKNKITVDFTDCNNKTIASNEGKSNIKEIEPGMQDALKSALKNINVSNPQSTAGNAVSRSVTTQNPVAGTVTAAPSEVTKPATAAEKTSLKSAEVYSNGGQNLNKINISEDQFILAAPNSSTPYAVFKASTKKDVFRVQLQDGTQTLGYIENGQIVVEIPNTDGSYRQEVFQETVIRAY